MIINPTTQGCQCPQHSGQHSGPRGGMLVVLSQHTHPAVLGSWLVRRWNKNRGHQRDDDAASTAAAVSEEEAYARCDLVSAYTAGGPPRSRANFEIDSYADLCGL